MGCTELKRYMLSRSSCSQLLHLQITASYLVGYVEISRLRNEETIILMPNKLYLPVGILLRLFHLYHDMPERMSPVIYMYVVELRHRSDSVVGISSR